MSTNILEFLCESSYFTVIPGVTEPTSIMTGKCIVQYQTIRQRRTEGAGA